jgi:hypothetical protein
MVSLVYQYPFPLQSYVRFQSGFAVMNPVQSEIKYVFMSKREDQGRNVLWNMSSLYLIFSGTWDKRVTAVQMDTNAQNKI